VKIKKSRPIFVFGSTFPALSCVQTRITVACRAALTSIASITCTYFVTSSSVPSKMQLGPVLRGGLLRVILPFSKQGLQTRALFPHKFTKTLGLSYFIAVMPPKPARTSSKRKIREGSDESDREAGGSTQAQAENASKKARKEEKPTSGSTLHTNKVLPINIVVPPKPANATRIASWNVSGLAASQKKVRVG